MTKLRHWLFRTLSTCLGIFGLWALGYGSFLEIIFLGPMYLVFLGYGLFKMDLISGLLYRDPWPKAARVLTPEVRSIPTIHERL